MRLLVTRGLEDAARTRDRLEAAGHTVLVSPVLVFETFEIHWPRRLPNALIATSARAFAGVPAWPPGWDAAGLPLYLVGRRTEAAARAVGFHGPATVVPDVSSLVKVLHGAKTMRLVYLVGENRKYDIENSLDDARHRLLVIETYGAKAVAALAPEVVKALGTGEVDGVLHYSRRSAGIFRDLCAAAGIDVTGLPHFCFSPDVAEALSDCAIVRTAATPDEDAMLALIGTV